MSIRLVKENYNADEVAYFRATYKLTNCKFTQSILVPGCTSATEAQAKVYDSFGRDKVEWCAASPVWAKGTELQTLLDRGMPILDEAYIVKPEVDLFDDEENQKSYDYGSSDASDDWCECNDCGWFGESDELVNGEICPDCGCTDIIRESMNESKKSIKESTKAGGRFTINFGHWVQAKSFPTQLDLLKFLRSHVISSSSIITLAKNVTDDYMKSTWYDTAENVQKFNLTPEQRHEIFEKGYTKINQNVSEQMQRNPEEDGWPGIVKDITDKALSRASTIKYEIDNCVRGAYISGTTVDDLIKSLKYLNNDLIDAINQLQADAKHINEGIVHNADHISMKISDMIKDSGIDYCTITNHGDHADIEFYSDKAANDASKLDWESVGFSNFKVNGSNATIDMPKNINESVTDDFKFAIEYDFHNVAKQGEPTITDHIKKVIYAKTADEANECFNNLVDESKDYTNSYICIGTPVFLDGNLIDIFDKFKMYIDGELIKDESLIESFDTDYSNSEVYQASSIESLNNYAAGLGDACKDLKPGLAISVKGYYVERSDDGETYHVWNDLDESISADEVVTIGLYGDEVNGYNSIDELARAFEDRGIEVLEKSGDFDFGWDLEVRGNARDIYNLVNNKITGYNCSSTQEFVDRYRIDESKCTNESLLQDLQKDHKSVKDTYGQEVYDALNAYIENGNDLGDVLYKESEWNKFADWAKKEKGIEIKSDVNESKSIKEDVTRDFTLNKTNYSDAEHYWGYVIARRADDELKCDIFQIVNGKPELKCGDGVPDAFCRMLIDGWNKEFFDSEAMDRLFPIESKTIKEDTAEDKIVAKNNKGEILVRADSGWGYTAFNAAGICIGGITTDDEDEAIRKFKSGKLDESKSIKESTLSISDLKAFYNTSDSIDKNKYPNFFAWYDYMVKTGRYKNESISADLEEWVSNSKESSKTFGSELRGSAIKLADEGEKIGKFSLYKFVNAWCLAKRRLSDGKWTEVGCFNSEKKARKYADKHMNESVSAEQADCILEENYWTVKPDWDDYCPHCCNRSLVGAGDGRAICDSCNAEYNIEPMPNGRVKIIELEESLSNNSPLESIENAYLSDELDLFIADAISDGSMTTEDIIKLAEQSSIIEIDDINSAISKAKSMTESDISSVEPTSPFKRGVKTTSCLTKDRKWDVTVDETGNIVARSRHAKPEYFKGHINDSVNDFPCTVEDNIILAAKEQFAIHFENDNDDNITEDIKVGDNVKISTPGNAYYDGRTGIVDYVDDGIATVLFDDGNFPKINNFDITQISRIGD